MEETHPRIDAHHHLWDPTRTAYPWMVGDALDPVRRPFTPDDLAPELAAQSISGTVLVQTISSEDETREFLGFERVCGRLGRIRSLAHRCAKQRGDDQYPTHSTNVHGLILPLPMLNYAESRETGKAV